MNEFHLLSDYPFASYMLNPQEAECTSIPQQVSVSQLPFHNVPLPKIHDSFLCVPTCVHVFVCVCMCTCMLQMKSSTFCMLLRAPYHLATSPTHIILSNPYICHFFLPGIHSFRIESYNLPPKVSFKTTSL